MKTENEICECGHNIIHHLVFGKEVNCMVELQTENQGCKKFKPKTQNQSQDALYTAKSSKAGTPPDIQILSDKIMPEFGGILYETDVKEAVQKILERIEQLDKEYYHDKDTYDFKECDICKVKEIIKSEMGRELI